MIRKVLDNGVEWLCLILMVVLAFDLMLGVFSRYVLFSTFTWYDEIARACFVWVVFLGGAVGVKRDAHFGLHLVIDMLSERARRIAAFATPLDHHRVLVRAGRSGPSSSWSSDASSSSP